MAYRSTYKGNFRGIGRMLSQPGMRAVVLVRAHEMLPIAVALSPSGDPATDPHPGLYRRSWRVEYGDKPVKFHGVKRMRPYARLVNTAPYAQRVEYGTDKVPKHWVARKTIDQAVAMNHAS